MIGLETLTQDAREVLIRAQDEARSLGHGYIGTEHLLAALLALADTPAVREMTDQGATVDGARQRAIAAFDATGRQNPYVSNDEALRTIGVDVDEIRRRAEAEFGVGAVAMRVGNPPFTPRVGSVLQSAGRRAGRQNPVGVDHILLGILDEGESVASRYLRDTCSDLSAVKAKALGG